MSDRSFKVDLNPKPWMISGYTKLPGGSFLQEINIDGMGIIEDDFESDGITTNGLLKAKANLTVHGDLKVNGNFRGKGSLRVDEDFVISGMARINEKVQIMGTMNIGGLFKAKYDVDIHDSCIVAGSSRIKGNLTVEKDVRLDGRTVIKGNLRGDNIQINVDVQDFSLFQLKSKIHGSIHAENTLELANCIVYGNVKARTLIVGKKVKILGNIECEEKIPR